jgi:hypothetical protein
MRGRQSRDDRRWKDGDGKRESLGLKRDKSERGREGKGGELYLSRVKTVRDDLGC